MECYLMTGDSDYLLRVVVPDIVALQDFIVGRLSKTARRRQYPIEFRPETGQVQDRAADQ